MKSKIVIARSVPPPTKTPRLWDITWQDGSHSLFPFHLWTARQIADLKQAVSAMLVY